MRKHLLRRALMGITTGALLAGGSIAAPAHATTVTTPAGQSADWLVRGLDHGLLTNSFGVNYFSSIDALLGLQDLGIRPRARPAILNAFEQNPGAYVGDPGATKAGALAKLLTAVEQAGVAPAQFAGGDLLTRLEGRVATTGSATGRARDEGAKDNSNTTGQSFVVRALAMADSSLADEAVTFLLKQQCTAGFFRAYEESADNTCDGGTTEQSGPDLDSTAFAVLALAYVRHHPVAGVHRAVVRESLRSAARWLVGQQAANGAFSSSGDFAVRNSNSTGVAAQALDAVGRDARARDAARWVARLRVTGKLVRKTALRKADLGAIAYTKADLRTAKSKGITSDVLGSWQYATAQAFVSQDLLS